QDVKMFFAVTNAVFDASISSWHFKRFYDYIRPVSAIHFLFVGQQVRAWAGPFQGTQLIDGAKWQPYQAVSVVTPPFAEYVSGHSIFSGSAARVLKLFTGSDRFGHSVIIPAGQSNVEPGSVPKDAVRLSWRTFSDAADEAGISRRYGGIHFVDGDVQARKMGKRSASRPGGKPSPISTGRPAHRWTTPDAAMLTMRTTATIGTTETRSSRKYVLLGR
ncbi:MAG: vanadium-dependent haloperoxidase, partial [Nitrospira sp.]|nr:vanadium-dependent haloperoxidase [Nitrospira sp.]